ncbi:hypothetical protein HZS_1605 [Henneguya salminicola]|nr:hypothetical protein HZS_1605 [Henneguya salminicola]
MKKGIELFVQIYCQNIIKIRRGYISFNKMILLIQSNTFRPKKTIPESSRQFKLIRINEATLGSGDLSKAYFYTLKKVVDFYNQINILYGTLEGLCTETSCPVMCAGVGYKIICNYSYEYAWADSTNKKPLKVSAPKYMENLLNWTQALLDDENVFPSQIGKNIILYSGVPFPKDHLSVLKTIIRRLFRFYAHIYHHHLKDIRDIQEEPHVNTSFKHFILFSLEFNMIEKKELAPLYEIIEKLVPSFKK